MSKCFAVKDQMSYLDIKGETVALDEEEVAELNDLSMNLHSLSRIQTSIRWQQALISVKKELNRLHILGTLITWFASYPVKSSQILKNHSIMLFTSNANSS